MNSTRRPAGWRLDRPGLMDHPTVITPGGALAFAGSSDQIGPLTEAFRALPRRPLVITGGPGTGKTTLAVQLLLDELLKHRQPGEPVPVLFSMVSWDPDHQPQVQDWLTAQLRAPPQRTGRQGRSGAQGAPSHT